MVKALVLEEKLRLSLRDIPVEEPLGRNDVRIKLKTVGVCGSDVHYYTHGGIGSFIVREPMILGHEDHRFAHDEGADAAMGIVVDVAAANADRLQLDAHVVAAERLLDRDVAQRQPELFLEHESLDH